MPAATPFTYHWYAGLGPPFTLLDVNVTTVPSQIVVAGAFTVIDGVTGAVTAMVALPAIADEHVFAGLVAETVYVAATENVPKLKVDPVPGIVATVDVPSDKL